MSSVYLAIGLCVLGVGMLLTSGWLALFWLAACSGVAAIVPTVLDEVRYCGDDARHYSSCSVARWELNWLPTDPNRRYELMARFYGPEAALFDQSWKLLDVERMG